MEPNRRGAFAVIALLFAAGLTTARADTYVVTNTNTSGPGSLAQAIFDSNTQPGPDIIAFNIPGSGVHRIDFSQDFLPSITDSLVIDGYTQPGSHPNTLKVGNDAVILIHIDGANRAGLRGLTLSGANAANCVIRGLALTGFLSAPNPNGSFFPPVGGYAILISGGAGTGNAIEGNFLGLNPDGLTSKQNYEGVRIEGGQSTIGGVDPAARNVISGNGAGVVILTATSGAATLRGNYLGTDASGTRAVGNSVGIEVGASDVVVGGTSPGSGNVISGNKYDGIELGFIAGYRSLASGNRAVIQGNLIGTKADGIGSLGNGGAIYISRSSDSTIGGLNPGAGNVIAFNALGVFVLGSGNSVVSNSIYANASRGIILGRDANNGQSFPVIISETISNGAITIRGTLQSTPDTELLVQFFADSQSLTTSKQTYLGSTNLVTDDNGKGSFRATFPLSDTNVVINATATDSSGNTSEFSGHPAYLQNISTRAAVGSGDNALIGGFITQYGNIIVRGIGPSLKSFGFTNVVADPTLELHDQAGAQIAFDDNWKDNQSQAEQIQASGLAPADDAESAILFNSSGLNASYTTVLKGKDDTAGLGVVEAYTILPDDPFYDSGLNSGFANLSSRGFVGSAANVMIGGFIIGGGTENPRIVVRAIGPSLKAAGVANALADPVLELHDNNGALIESNDNWADAQEGDMQAVELAPRDSMESAILLRLGAGTYTAIVRGKDNATGVALVEVYNLR